ncbi:MAG: iron dicitrate transport regulator FecR, partial [Adhaeribacter sp.]|nr:iron dicitrate transport regulator FecR [Adhaeribacter sp.]
MDYSRFTVQDFLMDDYFQNWVLKPDHENETFWRHWLIEHPQQKADILQARELMRSLDIKPAILPPAKVNKIWNNIEAQTREAPVIQLVPEKERAAKTQINWFQVAAVFIGILFTGLAFWKFMQPDGQNIMVATGFGETREITLPDNSRVVLNGNSS